MPKTIKKKTEKPIKTPKKKAAPKAAPKTAPKTAKPAKKVSAKPVEVAQKAVAQPVKVQKTAPKEQKNYLYANGKRKTSVATVRLFTDGKGGITINNRTFENYFPVPVDQDKVFAPLRLTNTLKLFDISVHVRGGGVHSQAEATRHGISKALLLFNNELRSILKHAGFLTRDSRVKERKKYGLKRARRAPQWQKR